MEEFYVSDMLRFNLFSSHSVTRIGTVRQSFERLGSLSGASGLSDAKIGSGLQEALKVGTENAVTQTGTVDGFLKNKAIKILMPKSLQTIEQPLRLVGYGPQIDEFVVGMNRAAEKAVAFAKDIFGRRSAL